MTVDEIKTRIKEFEFMMQQFHGSHTWYGRYGLSFWSFFANAFGKNKHEKEYKQLLEDVKLIYNDVSFEEYTALRTRIITAFEP